VSLHPYRDVHCWACAFRAPEPRALLCSVCAKELTDRIATEMAAALDYAMKHSGMSLNEAAAALRALG
jgi:hypothetical protein